MKIPGPLDTLENNLDGGAKYGRQRVELRWKAKRKRGDKDHVRLDRFFDVIQLGVDFPNFHVGYVVST